MKDNERKIEAPDAPEARAPAGSRAFLLYLLATAVLCGALIMVIEILGSRVIGPFFGVSLFIWTSLITVALVALAGGYAAGGVLADRRPSADMLYAIVLAAGILTLLIPLLQGPVLRATLSWGLRSGALASSLALFGPPLFLLGCVSPFLVRLAAKEMRSIGRTVGLFYALSTFGSVVGTVLTGFLFIAYLRVTVIFLVIGALLIALAAGYFLLFRRAGYALAALVLPLVLAPGGDGFSKITEQGTVLTTVLSKDTFYGSIRVVDHAAGEDRRRELMIDGLLQGGLDLRNGLPTFQYLYFMPFLAYGTNPSGRTCLVMGLGAGLIPRWFEARGVRTDVVDIDPNIVAAAADLFGFSVSGEVVIADARRHLLTTRKRYDYLMLDVYNGDTMPSHMLSVEALRLARERLTDQGLLAVNLIGSLGRERFMTASVIRTLEQVFRVVTVYPNFDPAAGEGAGNITLIAHDADFGGFDRTRVEDFPVHSVAAPGVFRHLGRTYRLPEDAAAVVLTDDYNPVDFFDIGLKEWVRRTILRTIDADLLI